MARKIIITTIGAAQRASSKQQDNGTKIDHFLA